MQTPARACPTGQWKTLRQESRFSGVAPYTDSGDDRFAKFNSLKGWKQNETLFRFTNHRLGGRILLGGLRRSGAAGAHRRASSNGCARANAGRSYGRSNDRPNGSPCGHGDG